MKKIFTKLIGVTLGLAMAVGVGVGVASNNRAATKLGADEESAYTIVFGNNTNSATSIDSNKNASTIISSGTDYVTSKPFTVNSGNCYYGGDGKNNIRIGKSANNASLSIALSNSGKVKATKFVVSCMRMSNNNNVGATLSVNGMTAQTAPSDTADNLTFTYASATDITSIQLDSVKAVFVYSIQVFRYKAAANAPAVTVSSESLFFRTDGGSQTVVASGTNFTGTISYSWTHQSGTDCVDLENSSSATVTMTPKNNVTEYASGVYRVTATYNTEVATADVTVYVDKGSSANPYNIAEARAAIDRGVGLENAYVKGLVYQVDSFNETYSSISYWISDDCTNAVKFKVHSGVGIGGAGFSSVDDIQISDSVVVKGTLTKYSSTYELNAGNELVTKASVASIAVKTAPTKVAYNSNECFDPTGLVVTATYDDSSTFDYSYSAFSAYFTFNPTTSTPLTNQNSISVSLFGAQTTQAISLTVREVTGVTLMGDMTKKSYYVGDSWDFDGLYLSVTWNVGTPNPTTVNLSDVDPSNYDLSVASPARGINQLYILGVYEGFDFEKTITGITVGRTPIADVIRSNATSLGHTGNSYGDVSDITKTGHSDIASDATYAAHYYCATTPNAGALQLNPSKSSYVCVTSSSQYLKSISASFANANNQTVYFYGSNTAYDAEFITKASLDASETSTSLGSLTADGTVNVTGNYKYLYIQTSGTTYVASFTIIWKSAEDEIENLMTQSSLNYDYENVALKFSGLVSKTLWDKLDTNSHLIDGVGVLFSNADRIASLENIDSLTDCYNAARAQTNSVSAAITKACSDYGIINRYAEVSENVPAVNGENYCKWSIVKKVSTSLQDKIYVATAYIVVNDDIVFLQQTSASINGLLAA